jgi:hypothetical protein
MNSKYRGMRIEWDIDECAQPYELQPIAQGKALREPLTRKVSTNVSNRFQLLNMDGEEEDEIAATFQSKKSAGIAAL